MQQPVAYAVAPNGQIVKSRTTHDRYTHAILWQRPDGQWVRSSMHTRGDLAEKKMAQHPDGYLTRVTYDKAEAARVSAALQTPADGVGAEDETLAQEAEQMGVTEGNDDLGIVEPPINPAALFLLDSTWINAFEQATSSPAGTYRCKVCDAVVPSPLREAHFQHDVNRSKTTKAQIRADRRATMATKTTKKTAKDQGVPEVYLSETGNFRPGMDARYKSDLIAAVLGTKSDKALATFEAKDAHDRLAQRGWLGFLAKSQAALEAKATKASEKAAKAKAAKPAAKKAPAKREAKPDPKPVAKPRRAKAAA